MLGGQLPSSHEIPESCMKINEKLRLYLMTAGETKNRHRTKYRSGIKDENHFISSLFTLRASRRLPSAALLRARSSITTTSPISALQMKASDSCKIKVIQLV